MSNPDHCNDCDDNCIVKCSKCQARGYLLRNEGEAISSGDDIVICAQCQGTGAEPCRTATILAERGLLLRAVETP